MTSCDKIHQQSYPHAIRAVQVVKFFKHVLRHLEVPLVILLDNARIHRAKVVQDFLKTEAGKRITVFYTPPYAPEFKPIEWLWVDQTHEDSELVSKTLKGTETGLDAGVPSGPIQTRVDSVFFSSLQFR